jgi:hypothetical protein
LSSIIPGVDLVTYVETPSTSSRVLQDGNVVGAGNRHVWVFVDDPADVERARTAIMLSAIQAGMSWKIPRFSNKDGGRIVGHGLATLVDTSVWTPGRLVFDGQPTVGEGLTVMPLEPVIHRGERDNLVVSHVETRG